MRPNYAPGSPLSILHIQPKQTVTWLSWVLHFLRSEGSRPQHQSPCNPMIQNKKRWFELKAIFHSCLNTQCPAVDKISHCIVCVTVCSKKYIWNWYLFSIIYLSNNISAIHMLFGLPALTNWNGSNIQIGILSWFYFSNVQEPTTRMGETDKLVVVGNEPPPPDLNAFGLRVLYLMSSAETSVVSSNHSSNMAFMVLVHCLKVCLICFRRISIIFKDKRTFTPAKISFSNLQLRITEHHKKFCSF